MCQVLMVLTERGRGISLYLTGNLPYSLQLKRTPMCRLSASASSLVTRSST